MPSPFFMNHPESLPNHSPGSLPEPFPNPFKVSRSALLKQLLQIPSVSWPVWIASAIGLILIAVGSFSDLRLIVLGLMVCVAVIPGILTFIYFSQSLSPQLVPNLIPHTIHPLPNGYILSIWRRSEDDDEQDSEPQWIKSGEILLNDSDIVRKKSTFDYTVIFYKNSPLSILFLPSSSPLNPCPSPLNP